MSCKWGNDDCINEDIKCHLCAAENYHYICKKKKPQPIIKAKVGKRQGSKFEANNHINNQALLNDASSRMTPNSGAGIVKGDEEIRGIINIMEELKTHHTKNSGRQPGTETFTIRKEWLAKLEKEAKAVNKEFWYLKFAFKNEDLDHYVIVSSEVIMSMVYTMVHDRREKNKCDNKINVSEKRARVKEAENALLFAENELLKARIKELEDILLEEGVNL